MFLIFTPNLGKMIQFDEHIFQMGWLKPPTRLGERMFRDDPKAVFLFVKFPQLLECSAHLAGAQPGEVKEPRVDCGTTLCCQETQGGCGMAWRL